MSSVAHPICLYTKAIILVTLGCLWSGCTSNKCLDDAQLYGKLNDETICYLENKVKHGTHTKWFPNSEVKKFERTYSKDTLHGPYYEWYSNGQLKVEAHYNKGQLDGTYLKFYSNGEKRLVSRYVRNENGLSVQNGTYNEYYKNGNLKLESIYSPLGKPEGKVTRYRMNGLRISEYTYIEGKLVGKRFWSNNGMLEPVLSQK